MKILITGSNGLLGQKLVMLLQQQDDIQLIATAARPLSIYLNKGQFVELDITDQKLVERVIANTRPDAVINTAALTHVDRCETEQDACWRTNVTAVQYLADACARHNAHLVHLSTDFIFDGTHGPLDEQAEPNPVNFYGKSKLESERIVQQSNSSWCIVRTVLVYGVTPDMSRSNIVLWVKKSLEEGKSIQVVNDQWRTPTLAEDLAIGCLLAARKGKGIYHISGKDFLTPYDIAIQVAEFFQLDAALIQPTDSHHFKQPAKRPLRTGFIIDKAVQELGYNPRSFAEGLQVVKDQLKG